MIEIFKRLPELPTQRWPEEIKEIIRKRLKTLTIACIALVIALPPLGYLSRIGYDVKIKPYLLRIKQQRQVEGIFLRNKELDPVYVKTLARVII